MPFKFEKLEIWNLAMDFAEDVYELTRKFPKEEMYNLTSQFRKAADSIALNISEGSIGQSDKEQQRFVGYSIRSTAESVCCLYKSLRRKYITQQEFQALYKQAEILIARTITFSQGIVTR